MGHITLTLEEEPLRTFANTSSGTKMWTLDEHYYVKEIKFEDE